LSRFLRRVLSDALFLRLTDRTEQQLAKVLATILIIVMVVATAQLSIGVIVGLFSAGVVWKGEQLALLLGDLLNLLIALEVLQNITSYLRKGLIQIELVLLTAITAVARKVIVLPPAAESKPQLLVGLGVAVLCLAAAYWLVRSQITVNTPSRAARARWSPAPGPSEGHDDAAGH
jgi:uncharacterized membrane protein (DUF373 family)